MTATIAKKIPGQVEAPRSAPPSYEQSKAKQGLRNKPLAEQEANLEPPEYGPPKALPGIGLASLPPVAKDVGKDDQPKAPTPPKGAPPSYEDMVLAKWCEPGKDLEGTVKYIALVKKATPDKFDGYMARAQGQFDKLAKTPQYQTFLSAGMSDGEIQAVMLYSTDLSYSLNAVLRGELTSQRWTGILKPLAALVVRALNKVPKGARNMQWKDKLDPTKAANDVIKYDTVHRADFWNPAFVARFANDYQQGNTITENAFLSTTVSPGAYGAGDVAVQRVIENAEVSRSITDLSASPQEKEALFAPGNQFKITSIELADKNDPAQQKVGADGKKTTEGKSVKKPLSVLPKQDGTDKAFNKAGVTWRVRMKHVGKAKPADAKPKKSRMQKLMGTGG